MSWNDLRKGRYSQKNSIYFITFVVNKRQNIFDDFYAAQRFCQLLKNNESKNNCKWLTWVLMPDHFHGLLQLSNTSSLPSIIRQLKSKSAISVNGYLNQKGAFWQHAYFDHAIRKEENIKSISKYIVANPLRAKLVNSVSHYPFWNSVYL
ncbi:MAG: transposase [Colwellia sp.]